jgi:hypothetical protein
MVRNLAACFTIEAGGTVPSPHDADPHGAR